MMKKIIGYVLSGIGMLTFLGLYAIMVILKDNPYVGYIIMGIGYIGIILFIIGIRLLRKTKTKNEE